MSVPPSGKKRLGPLLESNRRWASKVKADDPEFFSRLVAQQTPRSNECERSWDLKSW